MKAEKPPASPQCTDCPLWKYGAVSCARFNLRYALNEMLKYHNTPTERVTASGAVLHFDSQKEARRFDVLAASQARGQIRDLRLQVDFTLQEAFTDTEGKRVRAIRYKADFTYYQPPNRQLYGSHAPYYAEQSGVPWEFVVEDVKSKATRTAKYAMKKKMLKDRFGYDITEV